MLARGGSYILGKFAASFWAFTVFEHTYAPRRYVRRIQANDASVVNFDIKTKPVGAEHAARGIERHRGRDQALKIRPRTDHKALPDVAPAGLLAPPSDGVPVALQSVREAEAVTGCARDVDHRAEPWAAPREPPPLL